MPDPDHPRAATGAAAPPRDAVLTISRVELVAMLAMTMALGALGIDLMLPAFDAMRAGLGLEPGATAIAGTVTAYFLGLAGGTVLWGPMSDRIGRRPTLFISYALYAVGALACAVAPTLAVLLAMRFVWGFGAAGARVVTFAVLRDTHEGDEMSRLASHIMAVFILVPVVAPTLGAAIVSVASWRWVFGICVIAAALVALWCIRLPETLRPEFRSPAGLHRVVLAARVVLGNRVTVGYTLSMTALFGVFISYLGSAELIFSQAFDQADNFPLIFGALASVMGAAMLLNARIVRSVGAGRLTDRVLVVYLVVAVVLAGVTLTSGGHPPLPVFLVGLGLLFGCHALLIPNMNAIALGPMAEVAGTASSVMGASQLGLGALFGSLLDHAFDGTVTPLVLGFLGYGLVAAGLVAWARPGLKTATA